ncbi:kinesin-like protein KIF18B [Hyperolius riggenbachi]|uniref:kinesin-like protein KIF18B n=1 Tax=Hyperolius riggenbachi TaxID=752182 RepID=UPI0035A372D9
MTSAAVPEEGNVSVVVRVRPPNAREQESNHYTAVQVVDHNVLVFDPDEPETSGVFSSLRGHEGTRRKGKDLKFIFDSVFGEQSTQQDVFEHTTKQILDGVLNGYNCSVFAYGATGAGKTHTMLGCEADPGVMYLTMVELYRRIEAIKEEKSCEVLISYLEVYNEQIQDLLEPKGFLAVREDPQKGVVVQGLSFHQPKSAEHLLQMLANGNLNRTQHPTDANASSSRSHAVFQIYVKQQDRTASISQDVRVAKMSLIDLAGSERASSTNAKGERLREGANINRSLLALINVINALADAKNKKAHIPYRDSKLTRLLKDSIGGNCRTVMIAAISPSSLSYDDTYNTLKYANRAKEIKLSLKSNVINLDCHISKYAAVCEELKAEVAELKAKLHVYENKESLLESTHVTASDSPEQGKDHSRLNEPLDTSSSEQETKMHLQSLHRLSSGHVRRKRHRKNRGTQAFVSESFERETEGEDKLAILPDAQISSTERLVASLLCVVRKQYSILREANLQTPEIDAEVQAVELLAMGIPTVSDDKKDLTLSDETQPSDDGKTQPSDDGKTQSSDEGKAQPSDSRERQPDEGAIPSDKGKKTKECEVPFTKSLKEEDSRLPSVQDAIPDLEEAYPLVQAPPTRKRKPVKRSRQELLPDIGSTLQSPVVPVKRRRQANTPCKSVDGVPGTPELCVKRPRKSSIPSRPNLRSNAKPLLNKANSSSFSSTLKETSQCTPKNVLRTVTNILSQTVTKGRIPLGTSALQNNATVPASAVRDMNTTFDLEDDWLISDMDKTVNFGSSKFPGWENVGVPQIDCTFVKSSDVPVFTTSGPSMKAPLTVSSATKSYAQRRRRSISSTSLRSVNGTANQSRIARLQLSTTKRMQRPPTIVENISCNPKGPSLKKTGRGTVAFGRALGGAPITRIMQLAATRS